MKLVFVSVLLLVPLLVSLLAPLLEAAPLVSGDLPAPAIRLLFDGENYVIAEGPDAAHLGYTHLGSRLAFEFRSGEEDRNWNAIRVNLKESNQSFAVDGFASNQPPNDPQDVQTIAFCVLNTSEKLKHLIDRCEGKVRLRHLTEAERSALQQYKADQQATRMRFRVIYADVLRMQSSGLDEFKVAQLKRPDGRLYLVSAVNRQNDPHEGIQRNEISVKSKSTQRSSFIVEGPATGAVVNCSLTDHPDLKPDRCRGVIQLRKVH